MEMFVVAPAQPSQPDANTKAFIYGQSLLAKQVPRDSNAYDRYRQFLSQAQAAPFCSLDKSETVEKDLEGEHDKITEAVVNIVFPENLRPSATALLLGKEVDPAINKLFDVTRDPFTVQAFILFTPTWSPPTFEAYYVKVLSREKRQGLVGHLFGSEKRYHVSGTRRYSRFTLNTPMLVKYMEGKDTEADIATFLSNAVTVTAEIQPADVQPTPAPQEPLEDAEQ